MQETSRSEALLREGERLDDLMNGRFVIQDPALFGFGIDAVLLAHFPQLRKRDRVMDLCTGSGVIPLIMSADPVADAGKSEERPHFTGLEIQPCMASLAERSVAFNGLSDRIDIVRGDVRCVRGPFGAMTFSLVTCNPPYMPAGHGLENGTDPVAAARHEILMNLEDAVSAASFLLKNTGRFAMVHRPQRIPEIFETMRKYHLEPKRMRMVHPYEGKDANLVLLEAVKCGKPYLTVEPPLVVYRAPGVYTDEILNLYGIQ